MEKKISLSFFILIFILILGIGFFVFFIKKGTAVKPNVEGFHWLTLGDPLFYSPFFEQEEFEKAIGGLKESETQLKEVLIENIKTTSETGPEMDFFIPILKENNLFPYQFLENLILANQKTNEFLENPSVELGQELLTIYDKAADAYIQDISSKIKILETIKSHAGGKPFFLFFVDSVSSSEVAKNDFLAIKENGYKLKEEIEKRRNCLLGKEDCKALLKIKDNASFLASIESMESEEFDLKGEKIDFIKSVLPYYFSRQSEVRGPYKIKSFCWQSPGFEHWLYLVYRKQDGKTLVLPKLANQNYYWTLDAEGPTAKVDKALLEKGLKFISQPETTTYECMDLTFYPWLLTLDFLKKQMELGQITKEDLEKKSDYKLLIENHFGLMAPAINEVSDKIEGAKLYLAIDKTLYPPQFLFTIRTAYSIFYFPFAKSIWRIDKQLQYFVQEKEKPLTGEQLMVNPTGLLTFEELKKLGYTKTEIKKFHINIREFLTSLLESQP